MTSTQYFFDGFTALGCNIFRRLSSQKPLDGGTYHIHRVGRPVALGQHVLNTSHLQHGTHCATCDDTRTFRCRLHVDLGAPMLSTNCILQGSTIKRYINHVLTRCFHGFLNGYWHFTCLTTTKTNTTFAITDNSQCGERKYATALNHFGNAIHLNQLLLELRRLLFVNAHLLHLLKLQASFTSCVGQSLNATMITVTGAVKSNLLNTRRLGTLSNQLTNLFSGIHVTGCTLAQFLIQRGGSSKHLATICSGDLGIHVTRSAVNAQPCGTQLTNLHAHFACATQSFNICAHSPALFLLGFFASDLLFRKPYTFTLVGLGRTERADISSDLANLLLIDTANNHFRIGRSFYGNPFGQLILDRMGETQSQIKLITLRLGTIAYAREQELTLEARGYTSHHIANQCTGSTSKSAGLFSTITGSKAEIILFLLYFHRLVNGELKRSLGALHTNFLSV